MLITMNIIVVIVFAVSCAIDDVACRPDGAPQRACEPARPLHSHSNGDPYIPRALDNKYSFVVSADKYKPGETLKVTIEAAANNSVHGFFLQARRISDNSSVGGFEISNLPARSKLRPCETDNDAVTHEDPSEKQGLTFTWQAPDGSDVGNIRFVGAVALNHDDFFVGIESAELSRDSSGGAPFVRASIAVMIAMATMSSFAFTICFGFE